MVKIWKKYFSFSLPTNVGGYPPFGMKWRSGPRFCTPLEILYIASDNLLLF